MRLIDSWMLLFAPEGGEGGGDAGGGDKGAAGGDGDGGAGDGGTGDAGDAGGGDGDGTVAGGGDAGDAGDGDGSSLAGGGDGSGDGDGDGGGEGKPDGGSAGAPEQYEAFTMPDGYEIGKEVLELATTAFKDLNLSQEAAQKLVDLNIESQKAQAARDAQQRKSWVEEIKKDPDMGGADFDKNVRLIQGAVRKFGGEGADSFRQLLNDTGLGDHPAMNRFLLTIARAAGEDSFGGQARQGSADNEQAKLSRRFPTMKKQLDAEAGK